MHRFTPVYIPEEKKEKEKPTKEVKESVNKVSHPDEINLKENQKNTETKN